MKATQHAESVGMQVVGYYQACERLDDTALAPVGEKVAGKVKGAFEDAVAFVVRFCVLWLLFEGVILMDFEGAD